MKEKIPQKTTPAPGRKKLPRATRPGGGHSFSLPRLLLLTLFALPALAGEANASGMAADTTRRDTAWMERVRRHETTAVRQEHRRREEMKTWWITPGVWRLTETAPHRDGSTWSLRANATRWVTLTPALGVEWRPASRWAVVADVAWTAWSWHNGGRQYRLWEVAPAVHYYFTDRWFSGLVARGGEFNYKLGDTGRQGWQAGGGIIGGYKLPLCPRMSIEFRAGVGYSRADYREYHRVEGVNVRGKREKKNYFGIVDAGINLDFKF